MHAKFIKKAYNYFSKVPRIGVVTKVSDEIVHCVGKNFDIKKITLAIVIIYSSFLFTLSYFLLDVLELEFSYNLLLTGYYAFWVITLFLYFSLKFLLNYFKGIPDKIILFFYQFYILEKNPTCIYGLVIYAVFYTSTFASLVLVLYYLGMLFVSLILDGMRYFSLLNLNFVLKFLSPPVIPLLNVIVEALSKNASLKIAVGKM